MGLLEYDLEPPRKLSTEQSNAGIKRRQVFEMCIVFVEYQVNGPLVSSCTISKIALKFGARQSGKREPDLILFI